MMPTSAEIAYVAGLFEGEGTVYRPRRGSARLQIKMTDVEPLRRVASIVGGAVYGPYQAAKAGWAPSWSWQLNNWHQVLLVISLIRPWLGERRRAQLDTAIADPPPLGRRRRARSYVPCDYAPVPSSAGYLRHLRARTPCCDVCRESRRLFRRLSRAKPELEAGVLQSPVATEAQSE